MAVMTLWPGDEIIADDGETFRVERLMAYRGREGCTSWQCTRLNSRMRNDGTWDAGDCYGWHCSGCDAPTSMMGHDCPTRRAPRAP